MNELPAIAEYPPVTLITTSTTPVDALAGVVARTVVALTDWIVPETPLKVISVVLPKLVPTTSTSVPPAVPPDAGVKEVIDGNKAVTELDAAEATEVPI